jgi:glycosyltransferase involved in cell wall biosynthesis
MDMIYLDNAATSFPKPKGVSAAMKTYMDQVGATINRSVYGSAQEAGLTALRLRQQHGLDDAFVLAHVGRFDPVKNHTFLLDVFSRIVQQHPNSILLLAGTGSTMSAVKSRAQTLGLQDNIRFLGSVSNVAQLLTMADVFVFPSLYEGLGISLIEAQASGLPCFTALDCVPEEANVTGTVEYLPLEAGAAAWAEAILGAQNDQHARKSNVDVLCRQGYDIIAEAEKLQQFYLQKTVEAP